MLLSCKNINKTFGIDNVLDDISFMLEEKEKMAIIGVNGAGKTTLFKIITNQMKADSGEIIFPKDLKMGYLSQLSALNGENTIYEEILTIFQDVIELEKIIRQMEKEMSNLKGEVLEDLMNKYSKATNKFEEMNGYEYQSRIRGVISGLGFTDENSQQKIETFSGGQKTRVSLAKLLLQQPDLLLLDEPTNHLDIESIQWLEIFLKNYPKSVIIISHDRYFLDKVITKIVEIENGKSKTYGGNYTFYAHKKEVDRDILQKHFDNQQKEIKRQEEVIRVLKSYNREKSVKRARSRESMLNKVERIEKPENLPSKMHISLSSKMESGNDVLFAEDISKSFDGNILFGKITFDMKKGEKAALIGANGIGKTTLIRIILGEIEKNVGMVKFGSNIRLGYYDQEHQNISPEKTIFQEISDAYPKLTNLEIRNVLASFIFIGDEVFKEISTLSGGERGRVALAKLMLSNANFLILDEPTNHLDIYSKEILENALKSYKGTILYISHDRYFINNISDKIIELTPDKANVYIGNYDFYIDKKAEKLENLKETVNEIPTEKSDIKEEWLKKKEDVSKERSLRNLISKAEIEIEKTEEELDFLNIQLELEEIYSNPEATIEIYEKKMKLEENLKVLYEQWEENSSILGEMGC